MIERLISSICFTLHIPKFQKFILGVSMLILLFGVSCKKESEDGIGPSISLKQGQAYISGDTAIIIGKSYKVGIVVNSGDANITNLIMRLNDGTDKVFLDSGMNVSSFSLDKILPKTVSNKDVWTFIVRDKSGKSAALSFVISADSNSVYMPILLYNSVILGAQNNSDTGSFFDATNNIRYNLENAFLNQSSIDILYYYDAITTDGNTISSPNANIDPSVFPGAHGLANWTIKNETRYLQLSLSQTEFSAISNDSILIASYEEPSAKRKAKNLTAGNVYSFKTNKGKYGVFRVNKVFGTTEGSIDIDIKIQQ